MVLKVAAGVFLGLALFVAAFYFVASLADRGAAIRQREQQQQQKAIERQSPEEFDAICLRMGGIPRREFDPPQCHYPTPRPGAFTAPSLPGGG